MRRIILALFIIQCSCVPSVASGKPITCVPSVASGQSSSDAFLMASAIKWVFPVPVGICTMTLLCRFQAFCSLESMSV